MRSCRGRAETKRAATCAIGSPEPHVLDSAVQGVEHRTPSFCRQEVGIAAREMGDYEQAQADLELALNLHVHRGEAVYEIHTMANLPTL